jgi:hypothetical protein
MSRIPRGRLALVAAVVVVLAGCSGVPTTSVPQVVRTLNGAVQASPGPTISPAPGVDPRTLVKQFLEAGVTNDNSKTSAKYFLTEAAANGWQTTNVTVLDSDPTFGTFDPSKSTVTVTGLPVGAVDDTGEYTPKSAPITKSFTFGLVQVSGQWRINKIPAPLGLIATQADFTSASPAYRRVPLYFATKAGVGAAADPVKLVPDVRYSSLDQLTLASWLLNQLISGPGPALANRLDKLAYTGTATSGATVSSLNPIKVSIPGISQIDSATLKTVAEELAYTFNGAFPFAQIEIYDQTKPVPLAGAPTFSRANFPAVDPLSTTTPPWYYINAGAIRDSTFHLISGDAGQTANLQSLAVSTHSDGSILIAGLTTSGTQLEVGTAADGLNTPAALEGSATSRPEWVNNEVWIGVGQNLDRDVGGKISRISLAPQAGSIANATIRAVRTSPEGARVALVLDIDGKGSIWVGVIAHSGSSESVLGLQRVSSEAFNITDVAWYDEFSLRYVYQGTATDRDGKGIGAIGVDGFDPEDIPLTGLSGPAVSITAAGGTDVYVEVAGSNGDDSIWTLAGGTWVPAQTTSLTPLAGTAPIFSK